MNKPNKTLTAAAALAVASLLTPLTAPADEPPSQEELWRLVQEQQKQIAELKALVQATRTEAEKASETAATVRGDLQQTRAQLDATTAAVEQAGTQDTSAGEGWWQRTSIGGYGELHANFIENGDDAIDFHRFVLFVDHRFNDWVSFFSELEVEHVLSGNGKPGEVELEQAFIRLDWSDRFSTDAGLFLVPVGIINETHEPNTFYGVERNLVESNIIPTTWWEAGIKGNYRLDNGLSFDLGITSGLNVPTSGGSAYRIRSGRQKVAKALFNEQAVVGRVKYTGVPGLELAGSLYYQDNMDQTGATDFSGLLSTVHGIYQRDGFGLRALYARWDLSGDLVPADAESQYGWYIEPSYRWRFSDFYGELGVFARYSDFQYFQGSGIRENEVLTVGVNYWPTGNVVLKADIQHFDNGNNNAGNDSERAVNLGVGYQF